MKRHILAIALIETVQGMRCSALSSSLAAAVSLCVWLLGSAAPAYCQQDNSEALREGVVGKFQAHSNGHICYVRKVFLSEPVRLGQLIEQNYDHDKLTFRLELHDYNDYYFVNAGDKLRLRVDLYNMKPLAPSYPPGAGNAGNTSLENYRKVYLRDETAVREYNGVYSADGSLGARLTSTANSYSGPDFLPTPLTYMHRVLFSSLISYPCDPRPVVNKRGELFELEYKCKGDSVLCATIDPEGFKVLDLLTGYRRSKDKKLVALERFIYSDYATTAGQALPMRITGYFPDADRSGRNPGNSDAAASKNPDDAIRVVWKIEWLVTHVEFDKPEFDRKISFAEFDNCPVTDYRNGMSNPITFEQKPGMTNEDLDEHKEKIRPNAAETGLAGAGQSQGFPRWLRIGGAIALAGAMAAFAVARNRRNRT